MTTTLTQPLSLARTDQLIREARESRLAPSTPLEPLWSPVVIRLATAADQHALGRLAELDSKPTPAGTILIAELRGSPVAAVSLASGELIADPFVPTADITELLRLRARQLARSARSRSRPAHPRSWPAHPRLAH
jgi:hypothetical protein